MSNRLDKNSPLPRYHQICNALVEQIHSGELAVGEALPPERLIAEQFGVARLTVVKALDLLAQKGLIDKQHGRGSFVLPAKKESKVIAYIKAGWSVHHELEGISQIVLEKDYQLQVLAVDKTFDKLEPYLETCIANGVAGFIIYARGGHEDFKVYQNLLERGIPVVMIDRYYLALDTDYVVYDDAAAAFELTSRLIRRGHQRIAIIPGAEVETTSVKHRLEGYRKALRKHAIDFHEDLLWSGLYHDLSSRDAIRHEDRESFLQKIIQTRPTAVVTINDSIYEHFSHDLSYLELFATDEAEFALEAATFSYRMLPESSTLKLIALQPGEALGRAAARLLAERLEGRHTKKYVTIRMQIQELGYKTTSGKEAGKKRLLVK